MVLTTLTVDDILEILFLSYHKPLDAARTLGRSPEDADYRKAIALHPRLIVRYPHVLGLGQELVFVLIEAGRHDEAEALLKRFEKEFLDLDEEFLCRWGRLFKERGDAHAGLPWPAHAGRSPDADLAAKYYRLSLEKYEQTYLIRSGNFPGINKASMLLIFVSLVPESPRSPGRADLRESADLAAKILADRANWQQDQSDDDSIWHPATAGEAHLLLREWAKAEAQYREALRHKDLKAQSRNSMRRQVEWIVVCFRKLSATPAKLFDDPAAFFETIPDPAEPPALMPA
jgi:hypothetical protein